MSNLDPALAVFLFFFGGMMALLLIFYIISLINVHYARKDLMEFNRITELQRARVLALMESAMGKNQLTTDVVDDIFSTKE
jgi:thiosulfate reductase cytochrome b subunit